MKKTISVLLSVLLVALMMVPAFAAGSYTVTYQAPSAEYEGGYAYYMTVNGEFADFVEDPDGGYGYYSGDGQYYFIDNLTSESRLVFDEAEPGSRESLRYSPKQCENGTVTAGSTVSFVVLTSEKYDVSTVRVFCNGSEVTKNQYGEYSVKADQNLAFSVRERDPDDNSIVLARNKFVISLPSGDGFAAKPLKNSNYKAVYYGDSFEFRVKITKGYSGDNMKVKVVRGTNMLSELIGEEADMLSSITGETLRSTGVDADGYRTYKIKNVTSDCKVLISGVNTESSSGVLAKLKRILRLILSMLGINLGSLLGEENNPLAAYTVTLTTNISAASGVTYKISPEFTFNSATGKKETEVLSGESIMIAVTKTRENQTVNVTWTPKADPDPYVVNWQAYYDIDTGRTTWVAVWYVDGIVSDTAITITAN